MSEPTQTVAEATEENAMDNIADMTFPQLMEASRAIESKAQVLRNLSFQMPDRYQGVLEEAEAKSKEITDRLREFGGVAEVLQDREGTAPSLADKFGNYAENADVANLGGIGIDFSNTNPDLARQVMAGEVSLEDAREQVGEPPPRTTATNPSSAEPIAPTAPAA